MLNELFTRGPGDDEESSSDDAEMSPDESKDESEDEEEKDEEN